ncbi:MAG: cytochrome c [Xanthomonadaceae bacterium]|jgi:mono/diheme cytochrome c family protein|nr:cytochrome c [Xanthomonadaceae bacterium]
MNFLKSALVIGGVGLLGATGVIYFGVVHPGADEPHSAAVYRLIETARERAIAVRADDVVVPALGDAEQIRRGAGNYASMCVACHLAPGAAGTELSQGLYPAPPNLSTQAIRSPEHAFWVIKHGIKASGMPAWGKSMDDPYIWDMVAFLQAMPTMDAASYRELVASSDGHSHGGGESMPHPNGSAGGGDHHGAVAEGSSAAAHDHGSHDHGAHDHGDAAAATEAAPADHHDDPNAPPHAH